jgi:hypothetical protein
MSCGAWCPTRVHDAPSHHVRTRLVSYDLYRRARHLRCIILLEMIFGFFIFWQCLALRLKRPHSMLWMRQRSQRSLGVRQIIFLDDLETSQRDAMTMRSIAWSSGQQNLYISYRYRIHGHLAHAFTIISATLLIGYRRIVHRRNPSFSHYYLPAYSMIQMLRHHMIVRDIRKDWYLLRMNEWILST